MSTEIIIGRQGNQKLRITDKTVSRKHCKLTANGDGTYRLEHLSDKSFTSIDGQQVRVTTVRPETIIQLGPKFRTTISNLIGIATTTNRIQTPPPSGLNSASRATTPPPPPRTAKMSHYRYIWQDRRNYLNQLAEKKKKLQLIRQGIAIFTLFAMPSIFILRPYGLEMWGYIFTAIGIIGNIIVWFGIKNEESPEEQQKQLAIFQAKWVCPHCKKSLSAPNYDMLKRNVDKCHHCKTKFDYS